MRILSEEKKVALNSEKAPQAIGPYSQAIKVGNTVFVSGQLPINRMEGRIIATNITEQTHQSLQNIQSILAENNMTLNDVVKTTVLLNDIGDFTAMNEVYSQYFEKPFPARAAYQVAALPSGALIEIEAIAVKD